MPRSVPNLPLQSKTQRAQVLRLLIDAKGSWVPLPEILALGIAQFGARIFELRRLGFQIENKIERDDSGVIHSWYRLLNDVPEAEPATPKPDPAKPDAPAILSPYMARIREEQAEVAPLFVQVGRWS